MWHLFFFFIYVFYIIGPVMGQPPPPCTSCVSGLTLNGEIALGLTPNGEFDMTNGRNYKRQRVQAQNPHGDGRHPRLHELNEAAEAGTTATPSSMEGPDTLPDVATSNCVASSPLCTEGTNTGRARTYNLDDHVTTSANDLPNMTRR